MSLTRLHPDGLTRCAWAWPDQIYIDYHDNEWGKKLTGQNQLFEAICLEGFQAGLSWITILKRRENFRLAFSGFDLEAVAAFGESEIEALMQNAGIIRNRAKILASIHNAKLIQAEAIDLTSLLWGFAPASTAASESTGGPVPAEEFEWSTTSPESDALSLELKTLGFKFVGSTTIYALMQATGMVQDHALECFARVRPQPA